MKNNQKSISALADFSFVALSSIKGGSKISITPLADVVDESNQIQKPIAMEIGG